MRPEQEPEAVVAAYEVDLRVDLNTEDDTGLPWAPISDARDPSLIKEGAWIIVGSGSARAVAQVADIDDGIVHVRPLPGPVRRHAHLLGRSVA
jgi:hypothetical protein